MIGIANQKLESGLTINNMKRVDSLYSRIDEHNKNIFAKLKSLSKKQRKANWSESIAISLEKQMLLGLLIK